MSRGGSRAGSGRKRGFAGASKRTQLAIQRWARNLNPDADVPLPAIDVVRENMMFWHTRAFEMAQRVSAYLEERQASNEEMIKAATLFVAARARSQECARDLLPYEMPKLSQVTIKVTDVASAPDSELNAALLGMGVDLEALMEQATDAEFEEVAAQ
jgi:hypothetical protein